MKLIQKYKNKKIRK